MQPLKRANINILLAAIVFAITIFSFVYFVMTQNDENRLLIKEAKLLENKKFPAVPLLEIETNQDVSDEILNGEIMIVFILSTCEACKKELETISQIQGKNHPKIFGIMFEDAEVVKNFIQKHQIKFPILMDKDKKSLESLNLKYFPTNLKLKNGIIEKAFFGSPTNENELLEFTK
jgi:peroxiredoxin